MTAINFFPSKKSMQLSSSLLLLLLLLLSSQATAAIGKQYFDGGTAALSSQKTSLSRNIKDPDMIHFPDVTPEVEDFEDGEDNDDDDKDYDDDDDDRYTDGHVADNNNGDGGDGDNNEKNNDSNASGRRRKRGDDGEKRSPKRIPRRYVRQLGGGGGGGLFGKKSATRGGGRFPSGLLPNMSPVFPMMTTIPQTPIIPMPFMPQSKVVEEEEDEDEDDDQAMMLGSLGKRDAKKAKTINIHAIDPNSEKILSTTSEMRDQLSNSTHQLEETDKRLQDTASRVNENLDKLAKVDEKFEAIANASSSANERLSNVSASLQEDMHHVRERVDSIHEMMLGRCGGEGDKDATNTTMAAATETGKKKRNDADLLDNVIIMAPTQSKKNPARMKLEEFTPQLAAEKLRFMRDSLGGRGMVSVCYHNQPAAFADEHPLAPDDSPDVAAVFNGTMDSAHDPEQGLDLAMPNYMNALLLELKTLRRDYVSLCMEDPASDAEFQNAARCLNLITKRK